MTYFFRYAILLVVFFGAAALPLVDDTLFGELVTRATPQLQISLRETNPDSGGWHFALVIHPTGQTSGNFPGHELRLNAPKKCMDYVPPGFGKGIKETKQEQVKATADLIAQGAKTDKALQDQVTNVLLKIKGPYEVTTATSGESFVNCLDWTLAAVQALGKAGFVSTAQIAPFKAYHDAKAAEVREKTDANTRGLCGITTRALNSKPNPACQKRATNGKSPRARTALGTKIGGKAKAAPFRQGNPSVRGRPPHRAATRPVAKNAPRGRRG